MKKLALFLATITLLTSLSACGRRQEILNQIESEKAAESAAEESSVVTMGGGRETVAPEPGTEQPDPDNPSESYAPPVITIPDPNSKYPNNAGYQFTGGINKGGDGYYSDITLDELLERFDENYGITSHWNTPFSIIFEVTVNYHAHFSCYNKLTGNISSLCPDPLCRHTECIWGMVDLNFEYVNDTHIYFSACDGPGDPILYRCDLNRNHVESLELAFLDKICYAEGDKVYIERSQYKEDEAADYAFTVLDCKTKKLTTIYDKESVVIYAITGGDTVWYRHDQDRTTLYKTDLNFSHIETVLEGQPYTLLNANDHYLLIGDEDSNAKYLYHAETGRKIEVPEGMTGGHPVLNNQYIYYTKVTSDEEIAVSPLKDYLAWQVPQDSWIYHPAKMMGDGRVWRMNLETGQEEICAELSFNGIPIWVSEIVADGDALFVAYRTHEDFRNYYNQDYGYGIYDFGTMKYMCVDMTNGTIHLLNP